VPDRAREANGPTTHWYRVRDVLALSDDPMQMWDHVMGAGLEEERRREALQTLQLLRRSIHDDPVVSFHEEEDQDIDRVLDIFIRVNSAGTVLSYSDLLLSIATAQWSERDARESINALVDALNDTYQGFGFTKDLVLKAGLVMTDARDIRFKVGNFDRENMARLEENWDHIETALRLAAELLGSFGFSERTLTAHSVLIPIADYLYQREADESWLRRSEFRDDRAAIRGWTLGSLLKAGVWGSGLDTLLAAIRREMRDAPRDRFPVDRVEGTMARAGKALTFNAAEVDDLADTQYGKGRAFGLLALLYPGVDTRNEFHVDHVFPKARFTRRRLENAGVPSEQVDDFLWRVNGFANLQLLEGPVNVSKQAVLPAEWARSHFADEDAVGLYLAGHDLHGLPEDITAFVEFYETRRQRIVDRLRERLGVAAESSTEPASENATGALTANGAAHATDTPAAAGDAD
jgi:hypothetical protein